MPRKLINLINGNNLCFEANWHNKELALLFYFKAYLILACPHQGDFTWSSLSGRSVRLAPVAIQNLSELERARLQEVAYARLHQDYDLGCQITMPKGERGSTDVC